MQLESNNNFNYPCSRIAATRSTGNESRQVVRKRDGGVEGGIGGETGGWSLEQIKVAPVNSTRQCNAGG